MRPSCLRNILQFSHLPCPSKCPLCAHKIVPFDDNNNETPKTNPANEMMTTANRAALFHRINKNIKFVSLNCEFWIQFILLTICSGWAINSTSTLTLSRHFLIHAPQFDWQMLFRKLIRIKRSVSSWFFSLQNGKRITLWFYPRSKATHTPNALQSLIRQNSNSWIIDDASRNGFFIQFEFNWMRQTTDLIQSKGEKKLNASARIFMHIKMSS